MLACVLMGSCLGGNRELSEADRSAFGTFVNDMDSSLTGKWFTCMGVSSDADSLLAYLQRELPSNGLDTAAFPLTQIAADLQIIHQLAFDSVGQSINEVLPRLDQALSEAFVTYTTGQRYGFVRPDKLLNHLDFKVGGQGYARLFDYEVAAPNREEARRQLSSPDRLAYLYASQPSGAVYQALRQKLAETTDPETREKLAVNMERCRWQMVQPAQTGRRIIVNIPALQLWALGGDSVLNMRVVCGAQLTKTPLLHSEISHLQVNPEWIIPKNIVDNEVSHHAGDSAYFARNHYYIVDRTSGDTLSPVKVSAERLKMGGLRVGQRGGSGNSLGRIVFRFQNNFGVYLHDTNNRGAFNRDRRTLSHGCVRVQKPFDLACYLLPEIDEWAKDCMRISMDIRPETDRGRRYLQEHADAPRPYRLMTYHDVSSRVPVYIIYYTAYPNPATGVVEYWPDVYGFDKLIHAELRRTTAHSAAH